MSLSRTLVPMTCIIETLESQSIIPFLQYPIRLLRNRYLLYTNINCSSNMIWYAYPKNDSNRFDPVDFRCDSHM